MSPFQWTHRCQWIRPLCPLFFSTETATAAIYTLSLHDALPISPLIVVNPYGTLVKVALLCLAAGLLWGAGASQQRSEEHTSELQSRQYLVCRLLLEKKKAPGETRTNLGRRAVTSRPRPTDRRRR